MVDIAEVVTRARGAVFAVDEELRIVAWNNAAEEGLGLPATSVVGRTCYQTMRAFDADSGRPCHEQCPLVHQSASNGWVHSRVLKAQWRGSKPVNLDCMLVHCVLPTAERRTMSFVTPLGVGGARRQLRALSTMEALFPTLAKSTDLKQSLGDIVRAVRQATDAETAELRLVDPETRETRHVIREGPNPPDDPPLDLVRLDTRSAGAVVVSHSTRSRATEEAGQPRLYLVIPLLAGGQLLGALSVASTRTSFDLGLAARILFVVGGQLGVLVRWGLTKISDNGPDPSVTSPTPSIRFHCFGRFRITRDGRELPSSQFGRQKSLALLKLLIAHRGRPLHREMLVESLWPEAEPGPASNNLRVVLHDLRHTLEPDLPRGRGSSVVLSRGDLIYLDPTERCWTDVEEFVQLAKTFDRQHARGQVHAALRAGEAAASMYAEYMEDEPYLDWCIAERERLREVCICLLGRLADTYAGQGRLADAIQACQRSLLIDNVREETHRQLIAFLYQDGRRDQAIRQYEACRQILSQALDIEPDIETRDLYMSILDRPRPHH
ncbi:MAG TPA: BTAD domain-containing putative transcriptional regulator [Chloroflexota bacterium]|nr:BTAD domain-containing putative transcriptional regulator [Chloroflexota bacterium]